ncbi:MAG: hypothetical protein EXX96DRAFT_487748 [Benjaminiella poitrasii]|nr:MAG: hypothetical protein EXX96DRAFT_487748 [Benjaminiella poitrasii]
MFAAVLLQIKLTDHRVMFRTYPYTFTTEEASKVMSSLVFIHVHRHPDPADPSRQISTRTTTTFSMDHQTAKTLLQQFLSARLIMSATDPQNWSSVKDRSLWCPTLKGKYVLEEFTDSTQVQMSDSLIAAFNAPYMSPNSGTTNGHSNYSSIGSRVIHLDRLADNDDQITFERVNMTVIFKAMMASLPQEALLVDDVGGIEKKQLPTFEHTFLGAHCVDWLCDRLTVRGREEAEAVASELVLFGWIARVLDKCDKAHHASNATTEDIMTFKTSRNAIYHVTDRGCLIIGWKLASARLEEEDTIRSSSGSADMIRHDSATGMLEQAFSLSSISQDSANFESSDAQRALAEYRAVVRPPSMAITDSSLSYASNNSKDMAHHTNSQWTRLQEILQTPLLRMYFRDFLKANYCVENINFWVDHNKVLQNLKQQQKKPTTVLETLAECYLIYDVYLGPHAMADVNIDHTLRQEIIKFFSAVFVIVNNNANSKSSTTSTNYFLTGGASRLLLMPPQIANNGKQRMVMIRSNTISPERCLVKLLKMFSKVNDHVCRMMAEDSVPKFIKTDKYKRLVDARQQQKRQEEDDDSNSSSFDEEYEDSSEDEGIQLMNNYVTALSAQRSSMDHQRHESTSVSTTALF